MTTLERIIQKILDDIVAPFVTMLFILATLVFFWGLIQYLWNAENEEARKNGRKHMVWGIIGLLIMFVAGGIIELLCAFWETNCIF
ncbi:MAG: hypothetical protein A3C80_02585 [Candidatus Ryanbacteria bacterium RIFCSPHIGHO2_02_FULL_45_43]|uniref:Uncharacterized protein n=1 Tax=Candidatus Ryanbacteria bacterium RIFCSPHIGHO2_01_45_13 TaxID=1802112 RepID=A0A1G2FWN6_9BACT|nr:MAG: hypothetical protein A2718_01015 [Candidatus Ryanbacteria bacterium RIFCSPHIGHO2_01_FULL_44_130]OGZ42489.1 MAG: hypothetical protein A2W41_03860 [Candidatus Ryanbacteria bacterium RIFCSPHIGHO2_01_45_13]OGZ48506.1 MAG: hypothetical protein A3C80_02585 [Candidatus Ryanbacteria bacterium RIFCSPHIGHO2_02_FULL_45_43]OGZ50369.1 MAG: hypothetical protein A3E55_00480 [Candidatus Ryanbacteria bacterium RIFCSPHIGHO2_12_FULL_44_20]OGZ51710.1 MAG: hypothetical protein A3A17_02935 [Candidatus Ryanba